MTRNAAKMGREKKLVLFTLSASLLSFVRSFEEFPFSSFFLDLEIATRILIRRNRKKPRDTFSLQMVIPKTESHLSETK